MPQRLLFLFPHMVMHGGALRYVLSVAEKLRDQGHTVGILTFAHDSQKIKVPHGIDVIVLNGPLSSSLAYWIHFFHWQKKVVEAITQWNPDIILPQVFPSNWHGWLCKKSQHPAKLIWTCHEPSAFIHSRQWIHALRPRWKSYIAMLLAPFFATIDRKLSCYSDLIIANSQFTSINCKKIYGIDASFVAYPGVGPNQTDFNVAKERFSMMTVAHLSRFKRIDFLLDTFAGVRQHFPEATFTIVGSGECENELKARANQLGLGTAVHWHKNIEAKELEKIYTASRLYLHAAAGEPFGMAPLEALAHGTEIVAYAEGGPKEIVTDAKYGSLIDSFVAQDWIKLICEKLATEDSPDHIAARKTYALAFSWDQTAARFVEAIDAVLQAPEANS